MPPPCFPPPNSPKFIIQKNWMLEISSQTNNMSNPSWKKITKINFLKYEKLEWYNEIGFWGQFWLQA
jgi:hypothetical protein